MAESSSSQSHQRVVSRQLPRETCRRPLPSVSLPDSPDVFAVPPSASGSGALTMLYNKDNVARVPDVDLLTFLFESRHCAAAENTPLHAEASDPDAVVTKSQARVITQQIAYFLRHRFDIGKHHAGQDAVLGLSTGQYLLPCLFYGVVAADGVYSAGNPAATAEGLASQIRDGPAKLLVCSEDLRGFATTAARLAELPQERVLVFQSTPEPKLESLDANVRCDFGNGRARCLQWRIVTDAETLARRRVCIVYTSGSTGPPKGVAISHANMVAQTFLPASINRPVWAAWAARGRPFASRTLAHLPTPHISALQGYFVNPFYDGGLVYWMARFDFADFLRYNRDLAITTFFSLPKIYEILAQHPAVTNHFAALRIAYSGGAPLVRWEAIADCGRLGGQGEDRTLLSQTWGASETTGAATHMPPSRRDTTGSVGALLPNIQMRLVDATGADVDSMQPGEALLRGPTIIREYHNNPAATAAAFTEDGWYRTGDVMEVKKGLLYFVGRRSEIIKYHGYQVPPEQLEAILRSHPAIADAAVAGVPGEGTELPCALVALHRGLQEAGHPVPGPADVAAYVAARVHDQKRLRGGVVFVDEIPRLASGKMERGRVREVLEREREALEKEREWEREAEVEGEAKSEGEGRERDGEEDRQSESDGDEEGETFFAM